MASHPDDRSWSTATAPETDMAGPGPPMRPRDPLAGARAGRARSTVDNARAGPDRPNVDGVWGQLRAAGLIPTTQRRAVLAALMGRSHPVTAQHVHAELGRAGRRIGLSTVYRTLNDLADAGLLHTFSLDDGRAYRHCGTAAHQHLVCDRCGQVTECPRDLVDAWLSGIREYTSFRPRPDLIDIPGTCAQCQ